MQKLTKETKIWIGVLVVGIVVLALIQLWQSLAPLMQLQGMDTGAVIGSALIGSLIGLAIGILVPAFFYRLVVNLVSSEAEFSYGVSVFYVTIVSFMSHLIQTLLITLFDLSFIVEFNSPIIIGTILLTCGSYCVLLVYNKTITVKQALISSVILVALNLMLHFGLSILLNSVPS